MKKSPPFKRLYENTVETDGGCIEWNGQKGSSGYGQIKAFGKLVLCHRLSYELHNGPIPTGLEVMHACDNKVCVNPDHLVAGTHVENMRDMIAKGRRVQGKPNGVSGADRWQSNQVMVLGSAYGSQNEAEKALGLSSGTIRYWLKTGNPKARKLTIEEYRNRKNDSL